MSKRAAPSSKLNLACPLLALVITAGLHGYLIELLLRTHWLRRSTSVGSDVLWLFHAACAVAVVLWIVALRCYAPWRQAERSGLALCFALWLGFLLLNLSGKVWCYNKDGTESLWELLRSW